MGYIDMKESFYKANSFSLYCFWMSVAIAGFVWLLDVANIFIVDLSLLSITFAGTIVFLILAYLVKFTLGFESKLSSYVILFLLTSMFVFGHTMLSYHITLFMVFPMVCSVLYYEKSYTHYTFLLSSLGIVVSDILGYTFFLCDANMLLITTTKTQNVIETLANGSYEITSNPLQIILFFSVPKIIALFGFMRLLNYIKKNIQEKTAQEIEIRRKAEIDALTGIYNRNKFSVDIETMEETNDVSVIYLDLNDMKKTNDTLGHEQGDILINGLANILKSHQTDKIKAYRIGGDEFVVIALQKQDNEIQKLVETLYEEADKAELDFDLKLSVAIGYAKGNRRDIREVIKEADEKMYENKIQQKRLRKE